jgi:flagellar motor switch protein FliM
LDQRKRFLYNRSLKLGPAVGDWTTLQYRDPGLEEVHVSQIQNVNFDSLPRSEMKRLHLLHYRVAEKIVDRFSRDMDIKVELHTVMASQMTYEDFLKSQDKPVVQSDFLIEDLGRVNVLFSWELADMMINRLTGGSGDESDQDSFTTIELSILRTQMELLMNPFRDVWKNLFTEEQLSLEFSSGQFSYDQKLSLREAYLSFTFYMYFGKGDLKTMTWAYPSSIIRKLMKLSDAIPEKVKQNVYLNRDTQKKEKVPISVTLGRTKLTMAELRSLEVGDVIPLDSEFDAPIELKVGDSLFLKGQPGIVDSKLCVQLLSANDDAKMTAGVSVIEEAEEEEDAVVTQPPAQEPPAPVMQPDPQDVGVDIAEEDTEEHVQDFEDVLDDDVELEYAGEDTSVPDVADEHEPEAEVVAAAPEPSSMDDDIDDDFNFDDDDFSWDDLDDDLENEG